MCQELFLRGKKKRAVENKADHTSTPFVLGPFEVYITFLKFDPLKCLFLMHSHVQCKLFHWINWSRGPQVSDQKKIKRKERKGKKKLMQN